MTGTDTSARRSCPVQTGRRDEPELSCPAADDFEDDPPVEREDDFVPPFDDRLAEDVLALFATAFLAMTPDSHWLRHDRNIAPAP
ncbi:hypothetical protein ACFOWB_03585 [Chenggangzhangella methanolivorans]|uniref:hypothetical protein n=1 Tax=Chenggangzhangella methanolivorans TaxID=1437009 RepID=UPI003608E154